jgi:hypothetical protein
MLITYTLALCFEKNHYRSLVLIRKLLKRESIKGSNLRRCKNTIESIATGVGAV